MGITITYTEKELIALLKDRDNRAFAYLYDTYSGALYSIILQMLENTELANDVVLEVFLNIWRKMESYDPGKGRLYTWMLNVARNASIDALRSKSSQNSSKNLSISENMVGKGAPLTQLNIDNIGLSKILGKLKSEQRAYIELAFLKGYTQEEISEIEDIPLGTVKTRIRNAIMQLRTYLK